MEYNIPTVSSKNYTNPIKYEDGKDITNPDPYVIRFAGEYYCYSSNEHGVNVSCSSDLVQWEYLGHALSDNNYHNFWAPSVIYKDGLFHMYYSSTKKETDDCHQEFLKLAVAAKPEGPFEYKKTFFNKFSIDAHVVNILDGVYLFYSTNDVAGTDDYFPGTSILVDRLIEMDQLEETPSVIIRPSIKEEMFLANRFGDGRDWYTIEGAFYFEKNGNTYLMYSGNCYENEQYFIGYSNSAKICDPQQSQWEKYPNNRTYHPLVCKNSGVEGTGHNSIISGPNLVDDWIIYHGRDANEEIVEGTEQRVMRVDPLFFDDDRLSTNAPSYNRQDCPFLPTINAKDVNIENSYFVDRVFDSYVMETTISRDTVHTGAKSGIYLNYIDDRNYIEAVLHSGLNNITVYSCTNGFIENISSTRLSKKYNHVAIHTIKITKKVNVYCLEIDDGTTLSFSYNSPSGIIGLKAYFSKLKVINLTIVDHIELLNKELFYLGSIYKTSSIQKISDNGIYSCVENPLSIIRETGSDRDYVEEFTIDFLNSDSYLTYKLHQNDDLLEVTVEQNLCTIKSDHNVEKINITDNSFTLRVTMSNKSCWFLINGDSNGKSYDVITPTSVEFITSNTTLKRYRYTNTAQE